MGLRSRIKSRVKSVLGKEAPKSSPPPSQPAPSSSTPAPRPAARPAPTSTASPTPVAAKPAAPVDPEAAAKEAEMKAKADKHFEKTRKAVLKKLAEEGGQTHLGTLHDYSERRYFIAHKKFSNLMEGLVAEGLILYDHATGEATLTDEGRAYGEA